MNSKGLSTAIGIGLGIFLIIWLFKILMLLGLIASFVAILYFGIQVFRDNNNRQNLLLKRVLPAFVALIICSGLYSAANNTTKEVTNSARSTKVSNNSKKDNSSSDNDSSESDSLTDDDDSGVENDSSSDDNNESSSDSVTDSNSDSSTSINNTDTSNVQNNGDMQTDQQGTIVGNSRTMIYHTPDQHGYRMSSANAVYFNTEAEAQAAGYRKSEK